MFVIPDDSKILNSLNLLNYIKFVGYNSAKEHIWKESASPEYRARSTETKIFWDETFTLFTARLNIFPIIISPIIISVVEKSTKIRRKWWSLDRLPPGPFAIYFWEQKGFSSNVTADLADLHVIKSNRNRNRKQVVRKSKRRIIPVSRLDGKASIVNRYRRRQLKKRMNRDKANPHLIEDQVLSCNWLDVT